MAPLLIGPIAPLHGLGGAKDLPIPAPLAISGGTAALVVSFCVLILAWRSPRYDDPAPAAPEGRPHSGRPLPGLLASVLDSIWFRAVLRLVGFAFAGYVGWAMFAGPDLTTNPTFGVFYVLLWVGIVPTSVLFGRIYRALSPVRSIHLVISRLVGADPRTGVMSYPERLGYWPAAVGLFAFVWQELINPNMAFLGASGLHPGVRTWLIGYVLVMLIGAALFGEVWLARADPFEVYSSLLAKLSPWARRDDGTLVWRSPLANLATVRPLPGLVAVVAVLFGSTAFDSYKDTVRWVTFVSDTGISPEPLNTLALLLFSLIIGVSFTLATKTTGIDEHDPDSVRRRDLPRLLAPSVLPIIVGYMIAHYLSYFVEQGQQTILQLSDPMVKGQNLLGTANWSVDFWLSYHPTALATIKVLAVVTGHIVGVTSAHDRALRLLPRRHQVIGQLGLLVIMVAYTATGLYLLFGS